ncbi:hypothetical protein GQ457_02G022340 [Hibiscus cannabinus]
MIVVISPPSAALGQDLPSWHWEQNHCFSIKSAYSALDTDVYHVHNFNWKLVWSIKLPQRIKVFLWLVAHDRLLTNVEQNRRHLVDSDVYSFCHGRSETLLHVLSDCSMAQSVWRVVIKHDKLRDFCALPLDVCLIMDVHYVFRCDFLLCCERLAREFVAEFHRSHLSVSRTSRAIYHWAKPLISWIKANSDGVVRTSDSCAAAGGVIHDAYGCWIYGCARSIGRCLMAELWASLVVSVELVELVHREADAG